VPLQNKTYRQLIDEQIQIRVTPERLDLDQNTLDQLKAWFQHTVLHFYAYFSPSNERAQSDLEWAFDKIERKFADVHIARIIELILEFPKSKPSLIELKQVIETRRL
jgi:hypothetical protein